MSAAAASLAVQHDALLPRPPGGNGPGALLALAVHGALLLALTTAVDWRAHAPELVSAELWAAVPQIAAPAPPPPPPPATQPAPLPPRAPVLRTPSNEVDADIAVERARQRKLEAEQKRAATRQAEDDRKKADAAEKKKAAEERQKAEAEKKQREQDEREAKAAEERLAQQREANLRRIIGQAGGATGNADSSGTAAHNAAPSAAYAGRLIAHIRPHITYTGQAPATAKADIEVRAAPGGTIISRNISKHSGFPDWDDAVLRAIDKAGTLPRDTDGRVPAQLTIAFRRADSRD